MPATLTAAAAYLASKRVVATTLTTAEIEEHVPRALRENAAFSAQTIYAEHLSETIRDITTAPSMVAPLTRTEIRTRISCACGSATSRRRRRRHSQRPILLICAPAQSSRVKRTSAQRPRLLAWRSTQKTHPAQSGPRRRCTAL